MYVAKPINILDIFHIMLTIKQIKDKQTIRITKNEISLHMSLDFLLFLMQYNCEDDTQHYR